MSEVVAQLNDDWRIIVHPKGSQWALQRLSHPKDGPGEWSDRCYCRSRAGLVMFADEYVNRRDLVRTGLYDRQYKTTVLITPEGADALAALPEWFPEEQA